MAGRRGARRRGSIEAFLCGWNVYLVIMGLLLALSAGKSTALGRLALAASLLSVFASVSIYRPLAGEDMLRLARVAVLGVAVLGVVLGRRPDTRLIAVLYGGAAALPVALSVWSP